MKKLTIFLLTSIMMIGVTFGQFNTYHFEGVEAFAMPEGLIDPETSNKYFDIDEEKFGYTTLCIQYEVGKTFLVNSKDDVVEYLPYTIADRPKQVITLNSGLILVNTGKNLYDLATGQTFGNLEGYMVDANGGFSVVYSAETNTLYFGGSMMDGFGYKALESGMVNFFPEYDPEGYSGYNPGHMIIMEGNVYFYDETGIWKFDTEFDEFDLLYVGSFFGGAEIKQMPDGYWYVFGMDADLDATIWRFIGDEFVQVYDKNGELYYLNGEYFMIGSAGPEDDGYFHYFDIVTGITSPVVASGQRVNDSGANVVIIGGEFWFYSTGINSNITDIEGMFGYPVQRLTDDEVVGITNASQMSFTIYPNPATEWVKIEGLDPMGPIWMTDATGRSIEVILIGENTVDVSQLPSGIYFLNGQRLLIQK